jgi:coiled-coil domain-containing protein 115
MDHSGIDSLLERYLELLDQYTKLTKMLNDHQKGMYQSLARANFSAERGMRYGPDFFDERSEASRVVAVRTSDEDVPSYALVSAAELLNVGNDADTSKGNFGVSKEGHRRPRDPLTWFGLMSPSTLRTAQIEAVLAVEVVPKLANVVEEMKSLEKQVRRARKKRMKAASEVSREQLQPKD